MSRLVLLLLMTLIFNDGQAATVIYLHGKIVEDEGDNAVHPVFGTYEYGRIVSELQNEGHTVLSEIRPAGTDREKYANSVIRDIRSLLDSGTTPNDIVVIGFSKGAQIAILVSQKLANKHVRFVLQAVCGSWLTNHKDLQLHGNVLSQYETSDRAGSCKELFDRSPAATCEMSITTGLKHGAFYSPIGDWFVPQQKWIAEGACIQS